MEQLTYEAKRSKDFPDYLIVTCPHEDCGERPFLVVAKVWLRPRRYKRWHGRREGHSETVLITGRACPYCFKASRLPSRASIR